MKLISQQTKEQAVSVFRNHKVLSIKDLSGIIKKSNRTIYRYLEQWKTYSSYNYNGSYYTLQEIPIFDENGLWIYKDIRFSRHGNLKSTIQYLVDNSSSGMSLNQLQEVLGCSFYSVLPKMAADKLISREKHSGIYMYFSMNLELRDMQRERLFKRRFELTPAISCETAIKILIFRIKYPKLDFNKFISKLHKHGINSDASQIQAFFEFHGIEKKTKALS
jgi:predicted transcriptional regulator